MSRLSDALLWVAVGWRTDSQHGWKRRGLKCLPKQLTLVEGFGTLPAQGSAAYGTVRREH